LPIAVNLFEESIKKVVYSPKPTYIGAVLTCASAIAVLRIENINNNFFILYRVGYGLKFQGY
jgi:hypothetical protein